MTITTVEVIDEQRVIEVIYPGPQGPKGDSGSVQLDCGAPDTNFTAAFSLDLGGVA